MNSISRGIRNAFRNMIRTGSIVVILALSIGLIIAMLAARSAVDAKIEAVKSSVGNTVSIAPAGFRGFEGGGEALTNDQVAKIAAVSHVSSVVATLSDRMTTDDTTNLESGVELGSLGQRQANQNSSSSSSSSSSGTSGSGSMPTMPGGGNPMASVTITGLSSTEVTSAFGGSSLTWTSGEAFDASKDSNDAVIGKLLAEKNGLSVGDTFTAYGETLTVVGIYDAGTQFTNNGVFVSLQALQRLSDQSGSVTSVTATVDSVDNLASATKAITSAMGDSADVTNNQETAEQAVAPLESVRTISLYSLIGAIVAGSVIILLTMIMIVRERRREVGVMKAIGASNLGIMRQFIAEAMALTVLGLVVGSVIGIVASTPLTSLLVDTSSSSSTQQGPGGMGGGPGGGGRAMRGLQETVTNIESSVGVTTLAYGVGATLLIALLGSAIPSLMISKIKPAEAMRSE